MLDASDVNIDAFADPDQICVWVGNNGERAVRARDGQGNISFIRLPEFRYPGFFGYYQAGFFVTGCQLVIDPASIAPPTDLIKIGQIIIADKKVSLVVGEGPYRHFTFVGISGDAFNDALHRKVNNAAVINKWSLKAIRSGEPTTLFSHEVASGV